MNQVSEKQLATYLTRNGFVSEGTFEESGNKSISYNDSERQKVMKTYTSNGYRGIVWQSPLPIAIVQLKTELKKGGFEQKSVKDFNHITLEVYLKGKQGVTLSYSDNTETGKLLSLYSVVIQERVN